MRILPLPSGSPRAALVAALLVLASCSSRPAEAGLPLGGDPGPGAELIVAYGCDACHVIPGVESAVGLAGPPLTRWAERSFIAGEIPNTPAALARWITDPQGVEPGTAMPDLDVSERDARDLVAYLYGVDADSRGLADRLGLSWPTRADAAAEAGRAAIEAHGCGACHVVPGVRGARGVVGPPLTRWAERGFIAGSLANTPENVVRWLLDPPAVEPGTAMPDLGLSQEEARRIAAYLFSIR